MTAYDFFKKYIIKLHGCESVLRFFGYEVVWEWEWQTVVLEIVDKDGNDIPKPPLTALNYLKCFKEYGHLPMSVERPCTEATNSEIKRWLKSGSVIINGKRPNINDEIEFPITELVFFPKGKRKTTMI